jgi:hypothetical protein
MKIRLAVMAAFVFVIGLSVVAAGPAAAVSQRSHRLGHRPAAPRQVNGVLLGYAFLPSDAFASGLSPDTVGNTGTKLLRAPIWHHISSMTCGAFEGSIYISGFGQTAGAYIQDSNPDPWPSYPNVLFYELQYVNQFATPQAAAAYYAQALAKYRACPAYTNPGSNGSEVSVSETTVTTTRVGPYPAFTVSQLGVGSDYPRFTFWNNSLIALAGFDVCEIWDTSGTNDIPSSALLAELIQRVQKLQQ